VLRSYASGTEADDMHDDFKPQFKEQRSGAVDDIIRHDISTNKVLLYMKVRPTAQLPQETPDAGWAAADVPWCCCRLRHIVSHVRGTQLCIALQGDPEAPMCGFSNMACQILSAYGAL
jgi:glutaredoxin-related protein